MSSNSWLRILATAPIVNALRGRDAEPVSEPAARSRPARAVFPSSLVVATATVSAPGS